MTWLKSPVKEVENRSYVKVLEGPMKLLVSSLPLRGTVGNSNVSTPKGQIVTGQFLFGCGYGGSENSPTFADGICSKEGRGLLGDFFDSQSLRETLVHIIFDVSHCVEWLDLGKGPGGLNGRPSLKGVVVTEPIRRKPNSVVLGPSKEPTLNQM